MFAHCEAPVWRVDDFTRCFEQDYLQTLLPLLLCGASALYLCLQLYEAWKASSLYTAYQSLDSWHHVWSIRPTEHGTAVGPDTSDSEDEHDNLALIPTRTNESVVELDRPRGELLLVVVEELAVLSELAIHITALVNNDGGHGGSIAAIAGVASWTYIAILATSRLLLSHMRRFSFPHLWFHTSFLYCFFWVPTFLMFRSALIHPRSDLSMNLAIADFALVSLLAVVALTSRKGNRPVELEYEGDLKPSKEQTASVLSLATFGWVDAIVWQGYKKTYEMSDVWNLVPKDKAAAVLSDYRQFKKTNVLAWHLLRYFKRGLLIQAAWAACSGFFLFVPTILLKLILEYVEEPENTPKNAAWFYVILLFLSGVTSALADGQALWIGRKICIRLRAIIIGEIYAKALKRRAASGTDKVLGEKKKQEGTATMTRKERLKRVMSMGLKKKTEATKPAAPTGESQVTSGAIINLMAVDSFKVAEISAYLHFLWANTPVQVVVSVVLLYRILGLSSIAGICMMILLLPVNMLISKRFASIQKQILAATDARIHSTNEILTNIRIIKYFAWEQRFMKQVEEKRSAELTHLRRRYQWWAAAATVWSGAPVIITFLSFLVYTMVEKRDLVPSVAFTALSLFQLLRIPLDQLADMVAHVQESKVSVDRIEEYLNEPETDKYKQLRHEEFDDQGEPVIGFDNGTFSWGANEIDENGDPDESFKMMDLNLRFQVGQLNVIVGPTGCGKTSLLMALLGEMTLVNGKVHLPGGHCREDMEPDSETGLTESVAYCAQQAWLMNGTIKDNIIFASHYDPQRYKDVLVACSLQRDLEILDGGDQTLVGEKGVTLSGGQKQRISLARALYSKARHVLLDDVLSAVDSHTAKWIFDQALLGPLMYNRTCILVTHNVALCLPHCEFALVLENGKVTAQGTPNEIIDSGKLSEDIPKSRPASRGPSRVASRVPSTLGDESNGHAKNGSANGTSNGDARKSSEVKKPESQEETKAVGGVKFKIIIMYLRSMGTWWYWFAAFLVFAAQQVSSVATNVWIRQWANAYNTKVSRVSAFGAQSVSSSPVTHANTVSGFGSCLRSGTCVWTMPSTWFSNSNSMSNDFTAQGGNQFSIASHDTDVNAGYYLGVYAALGVVFMLITLVREGVLFAGSLQASKKIHTRLVESVMHAKFRFFDSTPLGQLMNRFSKDIEAVDQEIAPVAIGVVHCLASIITVVVLISVIIPAFLIAGLFISILFYIIGMFYINSSRDLKRLESIQRSPLYQQFGETLSGMTTIRAYGDERRFVRENLTRVNTHNRPFVYLWAANRWLAFRVDVVGSLVSFFSGAFVVLSIGKLDAGAAGLAMTYAVTFTDNVLWFVRLYAANEQNMNSVERIKEYLDVEQEAPPIIEENRPPGNWPSKGSVEFIGYSTRYRTDFDYVLNHITFKILPGEKVGVVGRTGAGKSSLALALFRALEAEKGKILVDDIDIGKIGLQDLRENIVMVPQDPTLFSGTIRSNLDPFGLFTDEEIFTALRRVQLVGSAAPSTTTTRPSTPVNGVRSKKPLADISNRSNSNLADPHEFSNTKSATTNPGSVLAGTETHLEVADLNGAATSPSASTPNLAENKNIFRNLNSPVAESGTNLSQGQRQLLCLARALLKAPKVLLMDEATASIDYATDAKIQETIREIRNTTITIAHRLQTIIDYDKVLVLDKGEVVEYGDPWDLVSKEMGTFRGMCEMSGDLAALERDAKKAYDARRLVNVEG